MESHSMLVTARIIYIVMSLVLTTGTTVMAQSIGPSSANSRPSVGRSQGLLPPPQLPQIGASQGLTAKVHLGPTGKPCLTVYGVARSMVMNPNLYSHLL